MRDLFVALEARPGVTSTRNNSGLDMPDNQRRATQKRHAPVGLSNQRRSVTGPFSPVHILSHLISHEGAAVLERFWAKVDRRGPDDCWPWKAHANRTNYGRFKLSGSTTATAHRVAWTAANLRDPGELIVRHKCDNPPCCNPKHLELGTPLDNARDKVERGRCRTGNQSGEKNGHATLTTKQVGQIVEGFRKGLNNQQIAARLPVGDSLVSRIRTGRSWLRESASFGWVPQPGLSRAQRQEQAA